MFACSPEVSRRTYFEMQKKRKRSSKHVVYRAFEKSKASEFWDEYYIEIEMNFLKEAFK